MGKDRLLQTHSYVTHQKWDSQSMAALRRIIPSIISIVTQQPWWVVFRTNQLFKILIILHRIKLMKSDRLRWGRGQIQHPRSISKDLDLVVVWHLRDKVPHSLTKLHRIHRCTSTGWEATVERGKGQVHAHFNTNIYHHSQPSQVINQSRIVMLSKVRWQEL